MSSTIRIVGWSVLMASVTLISHSGSVLAQAPAPAPAPSAAPKINYDEHVRPIFRQHCFSCHSSTKAESGLSLETYPKTMEGGSSGKIVIPGDTESSRLWALVVHKEEPYMPPKQDKLSADKLALIQKWIEGGLAENSGSVVTVKPKTGLAPIASGGPKTVSPRIRPVPVSMLM